MKMLYIHDDNGLFDQATITDKLQPKDAATKLIENLEEWFEGNTVYSDEITQTELEVLSQLKHKVANDEIDLFDDSAYWLDCAGFLGTFSN